MDTACWQHTSWQDTGWQHLRQAGMGREHTRTCSVRHHRRWHARPVHGLAPGPRADRPGHRQRRGHPGPGQDRPRGGRVRDRLRHHPQQLLPARDARADGAQRRRVGIGPGRVLLPPGRLPADRTRGDARGRGPDLRAAERDRLRVRPRRGNRRLPRLHDRPVPGLAGPRRHYGAAREAGRLRQQHQRAVAGLEAKARAAGVQILVGLQVTGLRLA